MNGRSRSLMLGAAVLMILLVATTGCGSKKKSAAAAETTTAAQTTTSAAVTTTSTQTSTSSSDSSGVSSIATAGNCKQLSNLSASFTKAITGVGENDFDKRAKLLKQFADKTPSSIRPDFEVLADAFAKYASALKGIHFTPGQVPDAATLQKLQQLSTKINQQAVTQASTHIAAWAQKNCTHS